MSIAEPQAPRPGGALLAAACFVVVAAGLQAAAAIVTPFLLALFVAVSCAPLLLELQERGVPTWIALTLVIGLVVAIFLVLGLLVGSSVNDFTARLPSYEAQLAQMRDAALVRLEAIGAPNALDELTARFDTGAVFRLMRDLATGLGGILTNAVLILLTAAFMLLEAASFRSKVQAVSGDPDASLGRLERILRNARRYLLIKTATSLATGMLVALLLALLGVDFPLLWGLFAFLLNYVPNIGSIIAAVPGVLLALLQLGLGPALVAAGGYLAINFAIGNGIEPRLMGRSAGLSTLVAFVSLVFWGWILGPVGMLLSVPLTMTAKIVLEANPSTHWIAVLLGPGDEEQPTAVASARAAAAEDAEPEAPERA